MKLGVQSASLAPLIQSTSDAGLGAGLILWALSLALQNKNSPIKLWAPGRETVLYKFYLR